MLAVRGASHVCVGRADEAQEAQHMTANSTTALLTCPLAIHARCRRSRIHRRLPWQAGPGLSEDGEQSVPLLPRLPLG